MCLVQATRKTRMEDELNKALIAFQEEYMGRTPADVRSHIVRDIVVIRLSGVLSPSEVNLAQDGVGVQLVKHSRSRLLENLQGVLGGIVTVTTGCSPASLHMDVSTRTGEMLLAITLPEDLEQKLSAEN